MAYTVVIPARYQSSRLPGKPVADLGGYPVIEWVYRASCQAAGPDRVWVATDDERIEQTVAAFGGQVLRTRADHTSGTSRLAEAARQLTTDTVVNVQGDEPFIDPDSIAAVAQVLESQPQWPMATARAPLGSLAQWQAPQVVKVVADVRQRALFFSRRPIPWQDPDGIAQIPAGVHRHVGIYAYRRSFLDTYIALPATPLEQAESLEQLRVLEHGYTIGLTSVWEQGLGIDTPEDLEQARSLVSNGKSPCSW